MKLTRVQDSLRNLNKDIGNYERQLSRVIKAKDAHLETGRPESVARMPNSKAGRRQPNPSHLIKSGTKQTYENEKRRKSRSPSKGWSNSDEKNIICKEVISSKNSPTRVEVVVRTKSSKKRSRSVQPSRTEHDIPTRDHPGKNLSLNVNPPSTQRKNASWGHIFQQQSSSTYDGNCSAQGRGKVCTALHYPSTDGDDQSSSELEKWVESIPHEKSKAARKSPHHIFNGNVQTSGVGDNYFSTFNPLRTLNFLVKELRGKVHKDDDENTLHIIDDMEAALRCIPSDACRTPLSSQLASKHIAPQLHLHNIPPKSRNSPSHNCDASETVSKDRTRVLDQQLDDVPPNSSPNLVHRLLSTVSRISRITGLPEEKADFHSTAQKEKQCSTKSSVNIDTESLQAQLEAGCKQLEETCHQMEQTCESLRQQKNQLMGDLKHKSQQLETVIGKNQQLTIYAADIRQEMLRVQQAAEIAQREHQEMKQKLLSQQRDMQESNSRMNQRLEEVVQENERLNTELQLCRLEKDKMHILMSNKDLEVAKLKKEIVDINTLVTEQLSNIRSLTGNKCSLDDLHKMMHAVSKLYDTIDGANVIIKPIAQYGKEGVKNHIGEGEGSRSRPICSSPTSSLNSSLYTSWQLMSDITTDHNPAEQKKKVRSDERIIETLPAGVMSTKGKDSGFNTATPVDVLNQEMTLKTDETNSNSNRKEENAKELKAELRDMFHLLKKQTSEAVNITLPSPPIISYDKMQETLGVSQWTELSASESTVLFHSSDESDSVELS